MASAAESWIDKYIAWIFIGLFFAIFIYVLGVVNPTLLFQHQQTAFFASTDFLQKHLAYPGGIAEYLGAFLMQLYAVPGLGALIITVLIICVTSAAFFIYKIFKLRRLAPFFALLLVGSLTALFSSIFYYTSHAVALCLALSSFLLFQKLSKKSFVLRLVLFFVFAVGLYYLIAAPFFVFVLISIFNVLFLIDQQWPLKIIEVLFYFAISLIWPIAAHSYFFLFDRQDIFTFLLPFELYTSVPLLPEIAVLVLVAPPLLSGFYHLFSKTDKSEKSPSIALQGALFVGLIAVVFLLSFSHDKKYATVLRIDQFAQRGEWQKVLDYADAHRDVLHRLSTLHYNRALYHTGRLCDDLFSYPQIEGEKGLFRNSGPAFDMPYAISCLLLEMGSPNSAQCWANEALSVEGESARVLKQLARVHMYKKEYDTASIYLSKLDNTLLHKKWARQHLAKIKQPEQFDPEMLLEETKYTTVDSNFLIRYGLDYGELKYLTENNPDSQMAFEYCLAFTLLSRRLDRFAELIPRFIDMQYDEMPKNVEEALILIGMSGTEHNIDMDALQFRRDYIADFQEFMSIIADHNNNTQYAQADLLKKFGDTYWYYHLYHRAQELK